MSERAPDGSPGRLVLVATPIGNLGDLSPRAVQTLATADVVAAEDTRRTRALLTHAGVPAAGRLRAVHEHNEQESAAWVVDMVQEGSDVAYVTDAGMPGISDPGARLVRACLDAGLPVDVVPGPSAVLTALVLSGFPTDRFVFEGFLPRRGLDRRERIAALVPETRTVVLYESPKRVHATLTQLLAAVRGASLNTSAGVYTEGSQEYSPPRRRRPRPATPRSARTCWRRWRRASRPATPPRAWRAT